MKRGRECPAAAARGAREIVRRVAAACFLGSGADPLAVARGESDALRSPQVPVEVAKLLIDRDDLLGALSHVGQTALLLFLNLHKASFFEGEWLNLVDLLASRAKRRGGWKGAFRDGCLRGCTEDVAPLPTPKLLLEQEGAGETAEEEGDDAVSPVSPVDAVSAATDPEALLAEFVASIEEGESGGVELARLKELLRGLDHDTCPAVVGDEALSQILEALLSDEAGLEDLSLFFRFLLKARVMALDKSPSQAMTAVIKAAASAHPRALSEAVLVPLATSGTLNLAQVELLRKAISVKELARLNPTVFQEIGEKGEWNENHLVVMHHLVQTCEELPPKALGAACVTFRARGKAFSSSLHFAKLINTIIQKFPEEARGEKEGLLEALECNTTFFGKIARSHAQKL
ncbi:FANCE domain-containing protein [Chloropicon primus]|uniref:Fanconi Anaemia group E protein C-terminal domain-containing protein n=1 Tax=Chloropicon primus TaxID=1764295 RepID=A0A5B8MBJ1_9CHLO|nr:hypothetical protein A3770_01p03340 [Chloropicon primus]UPQ97032.1 FANCE domain-containing protein [Chloropicon primus]|mmetsp:Transcript_9094/g.25870  ORF Transcript_9094/g.25870 Transcript_9094/m.25870 type:complete len:403 (-) Transcript_9094:139-1347(-)|eukprot:QDZ17816.1 hypothetical protein A3770_01p03340 [Chloropicon primus]